MFNLNLIFYTIFNYSRLKKNGHIQLIEKFFVFVS